VPTTTFFLVRHGESTWNAARLVQGHTDVAHLTERGRLQASDVAAHLKGEGATRVISSDLTRAVETAETISRALDLPLSLDAGLRERHYGSFEGRPIDEVTPQMIDVVDGAIVDPCAHPGGGESHLEFYARTRETLERLAISHPGERIIAVTHGGVIRILRAGAQRPELVGATWAHVANTEVWAIDIAS
jgi:2,3-bisphosphoglycerate-dependent phosphoglycerate mutase